VGNLLAGILNAAKLKGSIIQIIFTSFAVVGVVLLIPLKSVKVPPDICAQLPHVIIKLNHRYPKNPYQTQSGECHNR
ncbi:MAG: hypothetical protein EZS28_036965, partial [Streblomastix strix]